MHCRDSYTFNWTSPQCAVEKGLGILNGGGKKINNAFSPNKVINFLTYFYFIFKMFEFSLDFYFLIFLIKITISIN